MQSSLDIEIRQRLTRYLAGEISLEAFQEWFAPIAWSIPGDENWSTHELVNEIELRLAEFTSGHWTRQELGERLRLALETYTMAAMPEPRTSSTSELIAAGVTYQLSWVGTPP
jgi:hypothetical protein